MIGKLRNVEIEWLMQIPLKVANEIEGRKASHIFTDVGCTCSLISRDNSQADEDRHVDDRGPTTGCLRKRSEQIIISYFMIFCLLRTMVYIVEHRYLGYA